MHKLTNKMAAAMALTAPIFFTGVASAAETGRTPMVVLNSLADRIYVLGETTAKVEDMIAAEANAADEIRRYIASGSIDGLLAKDASTQSPLMAASYMGYPNVVAALLSSSLVKAHINDAGAMGLTPWMAANFSMRQSLWTCNPAVFSDPYKFVPMLVTQPYYTSNPTPPYKKVRELLERAGASADIAAAKQLWLSSCKNESDDAKTKVTATTDLLKTVQEIALADLTAELVKLQNKSEEGSKKP